jgi:hypothetical protein
MKASRGPRGFFLVFFALVGFPSIDTGLFASSQFQATSFSTSRDLSAVSASSLKLKNSAETARVVYGLYVRQFSYVAAGQSCSGATVMYPASDNKAAGAIAMPVTIPAGGTVSVGANYLYNMIYNAIYYLNIVIPASPPGCALPGCTWGSDSTIYSWCIYLGVLGPVSGGYSAKIVPSSIAVSSGAYSYNLASGSSSIGPISCDDQTMTCTLLTTQTQSF